MARQTSYVKTASKHGKLVVYTRNGKYYVRRKKKDGTFSMRRIDTRGGDKHDELIDMLSGPLFAQKIERQVDTKNVDTAPEEMLFPDLFDSRGNVSKKYNETMEFITVTWKLILDDNRAKIKMYMKYNHADMALLSHLLAQVYDAELDFSQTMEIGKLLSSRKKDAVENKKIKTTTHTKSGFLSSAKRFGGSKKNGFFDVPILQANIWFRKKCNFEPNKYVNYIIDLLNMGSELSNFKLVEYTLSWISREDDDELCKYTNQITKLTTYKEIQNSKITEYKQVFFLQIVMNKSKKLINKRMRFITKMNENTSTQISIDKVYSVVDNNVDDISMRSVLNLSSKLNSCVAESGVETKYIFTIVERLNKSFVICKSENDNEKYIFHSNNINDPNVPRLKYFKCAFIEHLRQDCGFSVFYWLDDERFAFTNIWSYRIKASGAYGSVYTIKINLAGDRYAFKIFDSQYDKKCETRSHLIILTDLLLIYNDPTWSPIKDLLCVEDQNTEVAQMIIQNVRSNMRKSCIVMKTLPSLLPTLPKNPLILIKFVVDILTCCAYFYVRHSDLDYKDWKLCNTIWNSKRIMLVDLDLLHGMCTPASYMSRNQEIKLYIDLKDVFPTLTEKDIIKMLTLPESVYVSLVGCLNLCYHIISNSKSINDDINSMLETLKIFAIRGITTKTRGDRDIRISKENIGKRILEILNTRKQPIQAEIPYTETIQQPVKPPHKKDGGLEWNKMQKQNLEKQNPTIHDTIELNRTIRTVEDAFADIDHTNPTSFTSTLKSLPGNIRNPCDYPYSEGFDLTKISYHKIHKNPQHVPIVDFFKTTGKIHIYNFTIMHTIDSTYIVKGYVGSATELIHDRFEGHVFDESGVNHGDLCQSFIHTSSGNTSELFRSFSGHIIVYNDSRTFTVNAMSGRWKILADKIEKRNKLQPLSNLNARNTRVVALVVANLSGYKCSNLECIPNKNEMVFDPRMYKKIKK
jgi:hypothetical protein